MNEYGRQLVAIANHLMQIAAGDRHHFGGFFRYYISGWRNQPGIRHQTGDISSPPLHDLPPAGPSIDVDRKMPAEYHMQAIDRPLFRSQDLTCSQRAQTAAIRHPFDLRLWCGTECPMLRQAFEQGF